MKTLFVLLSLVALGFGYAQDRIELIGEQGDSVTVRHALGETTIPKQPERVLVADILTLGAYASLGEVPFAACGYPLEDEMGEFGLLVTPLLGGETEHLGGCVAYGGTFPLERILALSPDLILVADIYAEQDSNYALLSEIAPTVAVPFDGSERLQYFVDVARVVGQEQEALTLVEAHYSKLDGIRARLTEPVSVAVVALREGGVTLFGKDFSVNPSFARMGLAFKPVVKDLPGYDPESARVSDMSVERLSLLNSTDIIIAESNAVGSENRAEFDAQVNSPLWQSLPAVQQGNVVFINQGELFVNASLLSFEAATDQVVAFLEAQGYLSPASER